MSSREARGGTELQRASSVRGRVDEAEDLAPPEIEPAELAPARLSLGWRLGILVSLVIVVVAGGIRFAQEQRTVKSDRADLQAMLLDGLIPLAHEIGIDKTNAYSKLNLEQGIELRWALPSTPYIDFSNDNTADYDARIILNSDTLLSILDANLTIQGTTYPTADATYDLGISGTNRWRNLYLSGTANVVDLACTDCINSTEITDIYVFNTSDTMSGSLSIGTTLGVTGNTTITGGSLSLNNGTSNKITWSDVGVGNPATAAAWRAQYYTDYGRGIESSTLWDRSTRYFKWYDSSDNTNYKMQLDNDASTPTLTVGSVNLTGSDLTYGGRAYIYTMAYANNGWTYCYEDGWVTPNCMDSGGVVRYGGDCNTFTGRFICEYAHAY